MKIEGSVFAVSAIPRENRNMRHKLPERFLLSHFRRKEFLVQLNLNFVVVPEFSAAVATKADKASYHCSERANRNVTYQSKSLRKIRYSGIMAVLVLLFPLTVPDFSDVRGLFDNFQKVLLIISTQPQLFS